MLGLFRQVALVLLCAAAVGRTALGQGQQSNPVFVETRPAEIGIRYIDGGIEVLEVQNVWRPVCGSAPHSITVDQLRAIAQEAAAREAAMPPLARIAGAEPAKFDLIFNITSALPAGAAEALEQVERYIEGQFSDPITVIVSFQFQSLPPGVLGATSSSFVSAGWPSTRDGLQNGMDPTDTLQDWLPSGSTIPIRYNGFAATVTDENRVFVTRANYRATIGETVGSAASITFSSNFTWDYSPPAINGGSWCFQSVIVHEVGHALGFVSGADFRVADIEMLDVFRFQLSDGTGDYNPDTLGEFMTTARMVDQNAPGAEDDVISDLITVEYRMSDGDPNQASHFRDQSPAIGIMDPTIGSSQTFYPNFFRQSDLNMFDAIGYDYPLESVTCPQAVELLCNSEQSFDNLVLAGTPNPPFSCGVGTSHTGVLWFRFVATASSARISTCNSIASDTTWAVYAGNCGTPVEVACSEDGGCSSAGRSSMCVTGLIPGETYYVQLASKTSVNRGAIVVEIECSCEGACCVPPPARCEVTREDDCGAAGGDFQGGGTTCPIDEPSTIAFCEKETAVAEQFATGGQESFESNVDWSDLDANSTVIDEFRADGRPIDAVRWWGSALNPKVSPDGWLISFHEPAMSGAAAAVSLGMYFCGNEVVDFASTSLGSCDSQSVLEYHVRLADCCLIHASADSRTLFTPGQAESFLGEQCAEYELGIAALVGNRFDPDMGGCVATSTSGSAAGPFWGWHTSSLDLGSGGALTGPVGMSGSDWTHGPTADVIPACGQANMAFQLLSTADPSAIQIAWDSGPTNGQQRLNSQYGGQITDYMSADDVVFSIPGEVSLIEWTNEEESPFTWTGRVRLEIYPDSGALSPDESGGPTAALWVPDEGGAVTRTGVGPGAFHDRYAYQISNLGILLPPGRWWFAMATEGTMGGTGRAFWMTARTSTLEGPVSGGQAHFRRPSIGFPTFAPWSSFLAGVEHDLTLKVRVAADSDCNCNGMDDSDELAGGGADCNGNFVLDECEPDCNGNLVADECDIANFTSPDCQNNGRPDECDMALGTSVDTDEDGSFDECDICAGFDDFVDADSDGAPDGCDLCPGFDDDEDADFDGVADGCDNCPLTNPTQEDCQPNGVGDACDVATATSRDCNENGIPDECDGTPAPQTPATAPDGISLNRYLALIPNNTGQSAAMRVTLSSIHHPDPPTASPSPDLSSLEGQVLWVGPVSLCADSDVLGTSFWCAKLQCAPHYDDWTATLGGSVMYVTGAAVIPSSVYAVQAITEGCNEASEVSYSDALVMTTARWADMAVPFQDPSPAALSQPNVIDISVAVDKVKDVANALPKPRIQLKGNDPDPDEAINVLEISYTVDGVKGSAYPFTGPASPCP